MDYVDDPLEEKKYQKIPGLVYKYPNRVLLVTTNKCPSNCPFCFRKFLYQDYKRPEIGKIVEIIDKKPKITEFIFSGGEPLLEVDFMAKLANELKRVKIFRIHSRMAVTAPEKINFQKLEEMTKLGKPIFMVIHVNKAEEIRPETEKAMIRLRKLGLILLSHSVFLRGVNDKAENLEKLFGKLVELGMKPYYIFHCDQMAHTKKWVVPIKKEIEIMTELRKRLSGLAYPLHVIDSASGRGKIPAPTDFWDYEAEYYRDFDGKKNLI